VGTETCTGALGHTSESIGIRTLRGADPCRSSPNPHSHGFREDYLLALRALSRNRTAEAYVKMLDRAQRFSAKVDLSSYNAAHEILARANTVQEPTDARFVDDI